MDEVKLFEACYSLAENLTWKSENSTIYEIEDETNKITRIAENLVIISKRNYSQVEDLNDGYDILLGAIKYLESISVPPIGENYQWFDYSQQILLELACPGSGPDKSGLAFLYRTKKGVQQLIDWANEPDEN